MHTYRVGLPFWKVVARSGGQMSLRIDLQRDDEAGVFIATSPDLRGLVVESASLDVLVKDLPECVDMLMCEILREAPKHAPRADLRLNLEHCLAA